MDKANLRIQAIFYNNPDCYPPIVNGVRLLAQAGFAVNLLCRDNGQEWHVSYPASTRVRRIGTRSGSSWREYFRFVTAVMRRADKHAALFIGYDMHGLLPARLLAARYRRPLVYHCHDYAEGGRKLPLGSHLVRAFERRFARTADLVVVPDYDRGTVMRKELHLPVPPTVAANAPIHASASSGVALTQALMSRGKRFKRILLRQGRIGVGHAIEATLRSMPQWNSRDWGFVLMGWGEAPYLETLAQLAHSLEVEEQFVVLPQVGYDQVEHFTSGAHVGHALYEPIHINNVHITTASNKIMEYMAAGLPLLVSNRPALIALVEKYGCGLTADESSPQSIAGAVNALLGDPALAQRMGAAGAQAFAREFSYERQFAPALDAMRRLACASST
jgi:glycosyltransferase involved in cell wall biosynthesis